MTTEEFNYHDPENEDLIIRVATQYYLEKYDPDYYIDAIIGWGDGLLKVSVVNDDTWGIDHYTIPVDLFTAENPVKEAKIQGLAKAIKALEEGIQMTTSKLKKDSQTLINLTEQLKSIDGT